MTGNLQTDTDREAAQLAIFEASRAALFSLAYRILGVKADAEDVVQDTFVKWHLHLRATQLAANDRLETPAAWLATVAKRTAIDRLRHLKHQTPWPAASTGFDAHLSDTAFHAADHAPSAQSLVEQALNLSYAMRLLLERLSAEEQVALLMREAFDADYASIAKILKRSAAHCRQMVHRAKDRVRDEKRNREAAAAAQGQPAIEPLLDAIARQDLDALVALTLAPAEAIAEVSGFASNGSSNSMSAMTRCSAMHAVLATQVLIARLRMGRIDLQSQATLESALALG